MAFKTIVVNDSGIHVAYTDTGAPSQSPYVTIVAIHGMCFSAPTFKRVQDAAIKKGVRFVALNRRNYPGTTPYSEADNSALVNGTKEQKDAWHRDRGHEVGMFIHKFINKENLPPISADRKTGGIILLGWSAGACEANATIAHANTLPSDVRSHLALYVRSLIVQDSHQVVFGSSPDSIEPSPVTDDKATPKERLQQFAYWVSGYFKHGDISIQTPDVLSHGGPSTTHPPSITNMTADEQEKIICMGKESEYELSHMISSQEQFAYAYREAFLGDTVRTLFPGFKATFLAGELSPAFAIQAYWKLGNDIKEIGKSFGLRLIPGSNHFLHWDDPERALKIYLECSGIDGV